MLPLLRRLLRSGMMPLIDSTKTSGLISFLGTMVGMFDVWTVIAASEIAGATICWP